MTTAPGADASNERPDRPISSTPVLRAALVWGLGVGLAVAAVAAIIGGIVAGSAGVGSALLGALVGIVFPALSALSILIANRYYGGPAFLQIFFGVVAGMWLVKFVIVIVALLLISRLEWVAPFVFYFSLVAAAVAALVVDLVVLKKMRLPAVSDVRMPGDADA